MGQRHQIYIITKEHGIKPYHEQWLYGTNPIRLVDRVVKAVKRAQDEAKKGGVSFNEFELINLVSGVMNYDAIDNKAFNCFDITEDITDKSGKVNPFRGDNNDGITIIDFSGAKIKYGFMFLEDTGVDDIKGLTVLNAQQYVNRYYKDFAPQGTFIDRNRYYKDFAPQGTFIDRFNFVMNLPLVTNFSKFSKEFSSKIIKKDGN